MNMKKKKKSKPKHRHHWGGDTESCFNCGYYEAYCEKCQTMGFFNSKGKLIDTCK